MVLTGKSTLNKSATARTQYITIPAGIVKDSQYPFKPGEKLVLRIFPEVRAMLLMSEGWESSDSLLKHRDEAAEGINAVARDALRDILAQLKEVEQ